MSYPQQTIQQIKSFRRKGFSITEISLALSVSKTTVFRHIQNVEILPQYLERWLERKRSSKELLKRNLRLASEEVQSLVKSISIREAAIIMAMLYWAEGAKKDFSFSNTDGRLIRVFLKCLRKTFSVSDSDIKASVRIYEDLDKAECLKYWSAITEIRLGDDTTVEVLTGAKKGKLQYGMCRIRVRKAGMLHKKIFALVDIINNLV